jgi:hypothetical protein
MHALRRKSLNPFRNPYRVMAVIVLPVLAFGATLALLYTSPAREAAFGWNPIHGTQSAAAWCAEWSKVQVSTELQTHADAYRLTTEYAKLCG